MRQAGLSFLVSAVLLAGPAAAQTTAVATSAASPADSTVSASHLAAARGLLEAIRFRETAVSAAMRMFDQQAGATPEAAAFRDLVETWTREIFESEEAELAFARAYAEALSEPDLKALTAFYHTPVGERLAAVQPLLAARGADIGQRLALARQADLQERMMARAAELQAGGAE